MAGALYLQEERVYRIVHPEQFQTAVGERAILDLGTRRPRSRADIGRFAIDRCLIGTAARQGAFELDLIISGKQTTGRTKIGNGERCKICLEKITRCFIVPWGKRARGLASDPPVAHSAKIRAYCHRVDCSIYGTPQEAGAGVQERRYRRRNTIILPPGEPVKTHRMDGKAARAD